MAVFIVILKILSNAFYTMNYNKTHVYRFASILDEIFAYCGWVLVHVILLPFQQDTPHIFMAIDYYFANQSDSMQKIPKTGIECCLEEELY